jgi:hypothetical protein
VSRRTAFCADATEREEEEGREEARERRCAPPLLLSRTRAVQCSFASDAPAMMEERETPDAKRGVAIPC